MQRTPIALCLALVGLLVPQLAVAQNFDTSGEGQMLARINEMRSSQNLPPLTRHPGLDAAARAHCSDMAAQQTLTHVSQSSGTPADRARAAGVPASTVSENVALHRSSQEAHAALIASDAHRGNMLATSATHVGLAALQTDQGIYVTQLFAAVAPPQAATPPSSSAVTIIEPTPPEPAEELPVAPLQAPGMGLPPPGVGAGMPSAPRPNPGEGQHLEVQPGSQGTVVLQRAAPGQPITAYWVYGSGRWWYYPMPPNAQPGQQLQVDRSVDGPPPGFPDHPGGAAPQAQRIPAPQQAAQPYPAQPRYPQAQPAPRAQPYPQAQAAPPRGGSIVLDPFRGQVQVAPSAPFYGTPPPPLTGAPTRAYRRAYQRWERAYRRWLRSQGAL